MGRLIDLTGKKFGRLLVIRKNLTKTYVNGEILWECVCSCQNKTKIYVPGSQLRQGKKKSCGCIWKPSYEEYLYNLKARLVENSAMNNQCLEWKGFKDKNGYGKIWIIEKGKEKSISTSRASWLVHRGKIPNELCVLHICDNPACHRIEHLFLGTQKDNMTDKMQKGRHICPKGIDHKKSKLKEEDIKEILCMKGKMTSHELCKLYAIAASTVRSIWQRKNWKHVDVEEVI